MEFSSTYRDGRLRLEALAAAYTPEHIDRPVPSCPGWTVRDVYAHLSGIVDDALAGRMEGVTTDPWTARQVERRAEWSLSSILEEWAANAEVFEPVLGPDTPPQLIIDLTTHEHDIRGAVGAPGARDAAAVGFAVGVILDGHEAGWPADAPSIRITSGERTWNLGPAPAGAELVVDEFELFRVLMGRRSERQIRALPWSADAGAAVAHLTVFGPAEADIIE